MSDRHSTVRINAERLRASLRAGLDGGEEPAAADAAAAAARLSTGDSFGSGDEEATANAARAKAERALRIAYRSKIVYDVGSGERGDVCLKDGRLIRAEVIASVCIAADAERGG